MPYWIVAGWFGYGMFALFIYEEIAELRERLRAHSRAAARRGGSAAPLAG